MRRVRRTSRRPLLAAIVMAAGLVPAAPAAAHIQVRPAVVAPGDPVLWTVLVPSEEESGTRQVELAVPKDVLPFSFEAAPGWTRTLRKNADGSIRSIVWRGTTRADGLATFRFLASAPEREGAIAWKAIQTYRDGDVVRWIGSASSDLPASATTVSSSAPRENAGGESGANAAPSTSSAAATPAVTTAGDDESGPDWLARGLGLAALLVAGFAAIACRRGRSA